MVVRKGIESAPAIQAAPVKEEAIRDLDSLAKQDKLDIKERQKFARKIIKAVRPQLEAALQAEADIAKKPVEGLLKDMELLFEASLETRTDLINGSTKTSDGLTNHTNVAINHTNPNGSAVDEAGQVPIVENVAEQSPVRNGDLVELAQSNGQQDVTESTTAAHAEAVNITGIGSVQNTEDVKPTILTNGNTPPDTNGYISALEHIQPPPPTPPLSNGGINIDTQNNLRGGGVPWYLENFNVIGTTVSEERWSGRDVVRGMSEELSEIDDEQLKGLMSVDAMDLDVDLGIDTAVQPTASTPKLTKKGKKKKPFKGFK